MQILDTRANTAQRNMEIDKELLETLSDEPILHLYDWEKPSITHGYFIKPADWLNLDALDQLGIDLARRPTGGGIVFHIWDLAFSFLMPESHSLFSEDTLENYSFVNKIVQKAVEDFLASKNPISLIDKDMEAKFEFSSKFCMARPTKYDVMLHGKKIAGAAQRKKTNGYLHQGTISISVPSREILSKTLKDPLIVEQIFENTYPLISETDQTSLEDARVKIKKALIDNFEKKISSFQPA